MKERYQTAEAFLPWNALKQVYNWFVQPHWIGDDHDCFGHDCFWYRVRTRRGHEFIWVDPVVGQKRLAFDHERLAQALAEKTGTAIEPYTLPFQTIHFAVDGDSFSFNYADQQWHCTLTDYALTTSTPNNPPLATRHSPPELLSPDRRWAAYVQAHNLWLRDTTSDERVQLTTDGLPDFGYGEEPGGTMTSVTEAIAGVQHPPSVIWSPNSRHLLIFRVDDRAPKLLHLLQHAPPSDKVRPILHSYKSPLEEDEERRYGQMVVADVLARRVLPVQIEREANVYATPVYFQQIGLELVDYWSRDGERLFVHVYRTTHKVELYEIDLNSGAARLILAEAAETPVYLNLFPFAKPNYRILPASDELIWFSERDGWAHLYLYQLSSGTLKRQITRGEWVVRELLWVDEAARQIVFTAGGVDPSLDPYHRTLYRVSIDDTIDGGELQLLTPEAGDHLITLSPSGRFVVDSVGQLNQPPITRLRTVDGTPLLTLEEGDASDLLARGFRYPEQVCLPGRDGSTPIYGTLYLPLAFDPTQRYPVIDAIYGGPQVTVAPHYFPVNSGTPLGLSMVNAIEDFWEPQALAQLGFAVIVLDGMGTPYRSRRFHDYAALDPANGGGLEDHIAAIKALAADRPYLDINRVGLYGHSAGGDNSCKGLLLFPDFYKVAVSSAGSHEMRGYIMNNETRRSNSPERPQANSHYADRLQGKLLLVTGDMDENCHPLHTYRVVDALIKANKDFDLLVLPNRNHSFTSDPYFIRRKWDYFVRHLLGEEPPAGYTIAAGSLEKTFLW